MVRLAAVCSFLAISAGLLYGDVPAFPGAQGYGAIATGGRGGAVYEVTNLNDTGPGSLRDALNKNTPRTIVFRVSGTIHLNSRLRCYYPNLTIAGQTAPGDGITLKGHDFIVDQNNVIIRYMRFRLGDINPGDVDAIEGRGRNTIIIDNCSASWSIDETMTFYNNQNITVQWCMITESLYDSHHEKGKHGYGGIWGGNNASFHHNLLAHHSSRTPRIAADQSNVDLRNNVNYNWGFNSCYGGEASSVNMVANYIKYGPGTNSGVRYRIVNPDPRSDGVWGSWHVEDNYVWGSATITANNWAGGVTGSFPSSIRAFTPHPVATTFPVTTQTATAAYEVVLANAGASLSRDVLDARIVNEVSTGTATYGGTWGPARGIIDTQETVGGWPELISKEAPLDSDKDGMPDWWEIANGLNPYSAADRNHYTLSTDYTNLEVYLNSLVPDPYSGDVTAPSPGVMRFAVKPYAVTPDTASMTAVTAVDYSGVEYYFANLTDSSHDSGWQDSPVYVDTGLQAGETYTYTVRARDKSPNQNEGWESEPESVTMGYVMELPATDAYWPLDEESGLEAGDYSGYGNHGELIGTAAGNWIEGYFDGALSFAGSGTRVFVEHDEAIDFDDEDFTVCFWMKEALQPSEQQVFLIKGTYAAPGSGKRYEVYYKDGTMRFAIDDDVVKTQLNVDASHWFTGEWVHLAAVRDSAAGLIRLYANAVEVGSEPDVTGGISQDEPLYIGDSLLEGAIDDVRIYRAALNPGQVLAVYIGEGMADTEPPSPDPTEWNIAPYALGRTAIGMSVSAATDESGVEYYFANLTDPSHDSGWQESPEFLDTELDTEVEYTYRAIARDRSPAGNETAWSQAATAKTLAYDCQSWYVSDLDGDCRVNMGDFAILAEEWMTAPVAPELVVNGGFNSSIEGWTLVALPTASGTMTAEHDPAVGNPAGSAKASRTDGVTVTNEHRFYQFVPVKFGEMYKLEGQWSGDLRGTWPNPSTAKNWADIYVTFVDQGPEFLPESWGIVAYKKAYGQAPNQNIDSTGVWDWESITDSPNLGPADGIFEATGSYMIIAVNVGGRGSSGTAHVNIDNISVKQVDPCPAIDLNDDCRLDWRDIAVFAEEWLSCGREPAETCW